MTAFHDIDISNLNQIFPESSLTQVQKYECILFCFGYDFNVIAEIRSVHPDSVRRSLYKSCQTLFGVNNLSFLRVSVSVRLLNILLTKNNR